MNYWVDPVEDMWGQGKTAETETDRHTLMYDVRHMQKLGKQIGIQTLVGVMRVVRVSGWRSSICAIRVIRQRTLYRRRKTKQVSLYIHLMITDNESINN